MALDSADIRVIGTGGVYVAPVGTAFPAFTADLSADEDFIDLGYLTEDGINFSFGREVNDIYAFQSNDPVRTVQTRQPKTVGFTLMQTGREQFNLALGGGTWTVTGVAPDEVYTYTPPDASDVDERAMIVEIIDGDLKYRWEYERTLNKEGVEFTAVRQDAVTFPIVMSVLTPADGAVPFVFRTNDDASAAPA